MGVEEKRIVVIEGETYIIQKIGFTHVELYNSKSGETKILHHSLWYKDFILKSTNPTIKDE